MRGKVWELLLKPVKNNRILIWDTDKRGANKGYDAAVVNLLKQPESMDMLRGFLHSLPESNEVCVVLGNKYSYQAILGRSAGFFKSAYSLHKIKNVLKSAGFKRQRFYPLLPRGNNMFEIVLDNNGTGRKKSSVKDCLTNFPLMRFFLPAYAVVAGKNGTIGSNFIEACVQAIGIGKPYKCIMGHPDTLLIISDDKIVRIPLDHLSRVRCRINQIALKGLSRTMMAGFAPHFLSGGSFLSQTYSCETKVLGVVVDEPIPRMEVLVQKAAELITRFHEETCKGIILNEAAYQRLFGREFSILKSYVNEEYKGRLGQVEEDLKRQVMGKELRVVWCHGDYKIENVLFDDRNWEVSGVIDWDLSRENGLPLLDIFYLLLYKDSLFSKKSIGRVLRERALKMDFTALERSVISAYAAQIKVSEEFWPALLVMFWVNHISRRCYQQLLVEGIANSQWIRDEVYSVIDSSLVLSSRKSSGSKTCLK